MAEGSFRWHHAMSNTGIIRFIIPKSYQEQAIRKEEFRLTKMKR